MLAYLTSTSSSWLRRSGLLAVFAFLLTTVVAAAEITGTDVDEEVSPPELSEAIVVSAIRAEERTPVTKRDMDADEIDRLDHGQEIPFLLAQTPSIVAYSDGGGGSGYSYFTLRGINQTRINLTLDGVPLNDLEDMNAYFADYGDFTGFLDSIQIQRGIGTSTVGAPAFGGSINFTSVDLSKTPKTEVEIGGGSFGTAQASVSWHSGDIGTSGFALYGRVSAKQSEGYRDNSGIRQRTAFLSATKRGESSLFKLTSFSGKERSQLSFFATDEATLKTNARFNPLDDQERDRFGQDFVQLQMMRAAGSGATLVASVYYNRGYGTYDLWDDPVAQNELRTLGLDGLLTGTSLSFNRSYDAVAVNLGVSYNHFEREHSLDVSGKRSYFNTGIKDEASGFAKIGYDVGRWHLFGDVQLRHSAFRYEGNIGIDPIDWTFLNPRLGARFRASSSISIFGSTGTSTREPARNDLFSGEDNPSVPHDLRSVRPERVHDTELGIDISRPLYTIHANAYAMEFRNEIAATGELSEIGLLLRRNVGRSYRRGIELDVLYRATPRVSVRAALNASRNRIKEWSQFYDVYDAGGAVIDTTAVQYRNVSPLLTPELIVNGGVDIQLLPPLQLSASVRLVSESFLDNTGNKDFVTPSYGSLDLGATLLLERWVGPSAPRLRVRANNVLDNDRVFPSGYSFLYLAEDAAGSRSVEGIRYYYPLATRNATVTLDFRF
ncbi:MAG TPA: TonB-dependent receptor plug domain-containing protein [Thermoanaerobaculia bacterium]|nr:TonB-dependent receptor plug domain-containing protein [Thermoanaerobaculia bacterium]